MIENNFHIFQNIATNENQITEVLCNFLHFKNFRNSFLEKFLPDINKNLVSNQDLQTQTRIEDFQPDLIMSNDIVELFFEIKVGDAPLQETQTNNYHKYIKKLNKITSLCFIIPKEYHKINEIKALVSSNEKVSIIYWPEIITLIEEQELNNSSQLFNEFNKLLKDWFEHKKISFTYNEIKTMFNKEVPKILLELFEVIDQVKSNLGSNNEIVISKAKTSYEHGFYVRDKKGKQLFFFGIWYELWKEKEKPLCIANLTNQSTRDYAEIFGNYYNNNIDYKSWNCQLLSESLFNPELIANISDDLNNLIEKQLNNI
ncbi:hypothetical protein IWQ47_001964 [Aquimarina sp. EL_43]|uniref:hypothetical protein n=1 Tax=unclassified Aquimarina TaxID=2627091 RepID=UPI0018C93B5B|nr:MULTISPECIES: hypothetical protein [unclassified Aquimarina]MBG6129953.1 hypothetical protein [Aquimarina sp. EL_35]MBG6148733.1 hypothetical protein [Aquimarina sp. EL_32]MBG6168893.1 hypothetical protein [Aquimarina sp. EL_43]